MSISPLAYADSLRIGAVDFVSPDEIKVLLDIEAPDSMALNTGTPRSFPRVNSYVLIPVDAGYLVGQVEWITIERSAFPKRKGLQDFGLIDLPFPLRKMSLNPIGTLFSEGNDDEGSEIYSFRRGVDSFPSVGNSVLLPTQNQLHSIVESGSNRRVKIGTSLLADNADIMIDPNRLFGRHLAILGNTGSGKSCSVAGLIRWSLEAAQEKCAPDERPNARFIVLDPNGEYSRAFEDMDEVRIFSVRPSGSEKQLQIPLWFWNSTEWSSFAQASGKTQKPTLRRALREIKSGKQSEVDSSPEKKKLKLRRYLSTKIITIQSNIRSDFIKTDPTKFGYYLNAVKDDLTAEIDTNSEYEYDLSNIIEQIDRVLISKNKQFQKDGQTIKYYTSFTENDAASICDKINELLVKIGGIVYQEGPEEDCPIAFDPAAFADHIEQISIQENTSQYLDFLIMRIRTLLSNTRLRAIAGESSEIKLDEWLSETIGDHRISNGTVTIIDLSLVPAEIIHIITAVIARMTLEALQRYRKLHSEHKSLPTVMVMEEAHTFVKRYKTDGENQDASSICCQIFEKIAREGRKYGLGLVLSSQRPSELSPTVLSQCNTFLLHRISNDRDQELVQKLVPDNLRGLLRDLPSLPSQNAILLGWASELPVLVRMNHLPQEHQPQSDDPDFWEVWTDKSYDSHGIPIKTDRKVNWKNIADDWQNPSSSIEDKEKQ